MMDLPQIITANAVGLMLMLILLMHMRGRTRSALVSDRLFVAMVYLTAVLCVLETASFLVDGRQFPGARLLNYVSNGLLFALDIVFAYLWLLYADFRLFGSHFLTGSHSLFKGRSLLEDVLVRIIVVSHISQSVAGRHLTFIDG